jgi:hypothetical protein
MIDILATILSSPRAWYLPGTPNNKPALIKQFDAHSPNLRVALAWGWKIPNAVKIGKTV